MTLLLINYEYPPIGAGAANATRQLALAFAALGHKVVVVSTAFGKQRGYSHEEGLHVYRLKAARKKNSSSNMREMLSFVWVARRQLGTILKAHTPDKAILFFSIPSGLLGPYLRRAGVPYVVALRGGDVPGMERGISLVHRVLAPIRRTILRKALAITANSQGLARASEQADPGFPVAVIPNGVDCHFFAPKPFFPQSHPAASSGEETLSSNASEFQPEADNSDGNFRFLFVGRFQEQKNLFSLLSAFRDIAPHHHAELRLVGDGPQKQELMNTIHALGLDERVVLLPWQSKEGLRNEYQSAHALINYSLYEGMPNAVMEGMACALPVIASRIMGHEELIQHGQQGLLVDLENNSELTESMLRLVQDETLAQNMGLAARQQVETNYSWAAAAQQFGNLLNNSRHKA